LDKFIYNLFNGFDLDFVLNYRNEYGENIKKFFEEKNNIMDRNNYEFELLSEDVYKINMQENKDNKLLGVKKERETKPNYFTKEDSYNNFEYKRRSFKMQIEYQEKWKYLSEACLNITDDCNLACHYCFV